MESPRRDWRTFALLMIDFQEDFWPEDLHAGFPELPGATRRLLSCCRREGIDVVHLRAEFEPDRSDWMPRHRLLGRCPCIRGSAGASVLPWAAERSGEEVVIKKTFDGFLGGSLLGHLRARGQRFLLVAGIRTSVCVLSTILSAGQLGFETALLGDCCADTTTGHRHVLGGYDFAFETVESGALVDAHARWAAQLEDLPSLPPPKAPGDGQVESALKAFLDAFARLDWEGFLSHFSEEATVFFPFGAVPERVEGRAQIANHFRGVFDRLRGEGSGPIYHDTTPRDLRVSSDDNRSLATFHLCDGPRLCRRSIVFKREGERIAVLHLHASNMETDH